MVRANHILIEPRGADAAADAEARRRAQSILDRIRGGADFVTLARDNTDDEATRDTGGDLGAFQRGTMLPEFERVVFAMQPGEVSDLIRTSLGYHIIKCQEYLPAVVQPLPHVYANTAYDAALDKADSLARMRADSLRRAWGTPARGRTAATKLGYQIAPYSHPIGSPPFSSEMRPFFERLETVEPGTFYPGTQLIKGLGYAIAWVDSVTAPRAPDWEQAKPRAIDAYRRQAGERAVDAKQAELDSMLAAGWSLDSLGTLWGGLESLTQAKEGSTLPGFGGRTIVDSLLFGARGNAPLAIGTTSPWVDFPGGPVRIRAEGRHEPSPTQVESRVEQEARTETDRALAEYFEGLKQRYPVKILDPALRAVAMPTVPTAQRR
jgi:peptidyl-prolyl cis-trans isomerase D